MALETYRKLFDSADWDGLGELYAPDAFLDANVPSWRFQKQGRDDIVAQYRDWDEETPNNQIEEWVEHETPWGTVVELVEKADTPDGVYLARQANLFKLNADGLITEHIMYCTGPWDADTVARHKTQAPMFRW